MKTRLLLSALLITAAHSAFANEDGNWMIRARALGVVPDEDGTVTPGGAGVNIDSSAVPELDISYFFTPQYRRRTHCRRDAA